MSATMITAIVQRTRNTLDMMHRGFIAQAPNVMKTLVRAAEDVNKLPYATFVDAEYVKGALAANRDLVPQLEPYVYLTDPAEHIIGVCNIHMLSGKFLVAQALYARFEPAMASESDDYINLLNEDLDIEILEDTIIFLANILRLGVCVEITICGASFGVNGAPALNTWASENYVASRKRGRVNEHFRSSDYKGAARKTLLSQTAVDAIIKDGLFNMIDEDAHHEIVVDATNMQTTYERSLNESSGPTVLPTATATLPVMAIFNRTKEQMEKIYADEAKEPDYNGPNQCAVCMAREAHIINMSCGHLACCASCIRTMKKCAQGCPIDGPKGFFFAYNSARQPEPEVPEPVGNVPEPVGNVPEPVPV
jgi:hypothetical protein